MKAAILGTTDYHATMQQIAQNALQRMAGYKLQTIDRRIELPPIDKNFVICADKLVKDIFLYGEALENYNPRGLYLFLAWVMVGSDNPYSIYKHASENSSFVKTAAILPVRIALGGKIMNHEMIRIGILIRESTNDSPTSAYRAAQQMIKSIYYTELDKVYSRKASRYALETVAISLHYIKDSLSESEVDIRAICEIGTERLRRWASISDEEALQIARQLLFDILDAGK